MIGGHTYRSTVAVMAGVFMVAARCSRVRWAETSVMGNPQT